MESKTERVSSTSSNNAVQSLLSEIYTQYQIENHFDSSTEASCFSDGVHVHCESNLVMMNSEEKERLHPTNLISNSFDDLLAIKEDLKQRIVVISAKLVRQLKQRNRLKEKNLKHCDTITAVLQAVSQKRWEDTQLKFTLDPYPNKKGFVQWYSALRAIVQLPIGLPSCWRRRMWVNIADNYFKTKHSDRDWPTVKRWVFSDRVCPTDETLGNQIVKDLHRTGYSNIISSNGNKNEDRLLLKRVLLAYARWNKEIGYCQGFNVIAALLLQVTCGDDEAAFKIMVYLIDHVLPSNYFSNNLQALSVDMAVFRDLLKMKLPKLSRTLDQLQKEANQNLIGSNYEPPLTNVFTMQWFLTLFATFLPLQLVLRIWDSLIVDGNEILVRVSLVVWMKLSEKVSKAQSADEFYSIMSKQMQDATNGKLINQDELVTMIYKLAPFPLPYLNELREKYTYNITPFLTEDHVRNESTNTSPASPGDDFDVTTFSCFTGLMNHSSDSLTGFNGNRKHGLNELTVASSRYNNQSTNKPTSLMEERMSTDIASLKQQYLQIRARQASAHLVYAKPTRVSNPHDGMISYYPNPNRKPVMVNHLLIGRDSNFNPSAVPIQLQQSYVPKRRRQRH